jgi:hypothetical protein
MERLGGGVDVQSKPELLVDEQVVAVTTLAKITNLIHP